MLPISLRLNSRTNQFPILNYTEQILINYNLNNLTQEELSGEVDVNQYYLEDTFPTFFNLCKEIEHDYNKRELTFLANYIYHLKGSIESIKEFNRFFGFDIYVNCTETKMDIDFKLLKINSNNPAMFVILFKQMLFELLFYDKINLNIVKVLMTISCKNTIRRNTGTNLLNYVILTQKEGKET